MFARLRLSPPASSSTLENWAREFANFCPDIDVQTYYGTQAERRELADNLLDDDEVEVVLTTYAIAAGTNKDDKRFLRKMDFKASRLSCPSRASGRDAGG